MSAEKRCPVTGKTHEQAAGNGTSNKDWWSAAYVSYLHRQDRFISQADRPTLRSKLKNGSSAESVGKKNDDFPEVYKLETGF